MQLKQRWIFTMAQRHFCSPKKVIYILSALKDGEQFNEMVILDSFFNTAPRAQIQQLGNLIFYSCKSKFRR